MLYFLWKLYKSWLSYGGDENYVPPLPLDVGRGFEVIVKEDVPV